MSSLEIVTKPPRKKQSDVPVHRSSKNEEIEPIYKLVYGSQFNYKRKPRHKSTDEAETENQTQKIKKKNLITANEQLFKENQLLNDRLKELKEHFDNKLTKVKEKLNSSLKFNEDIVQENNIIKTQYQDLLLNFDECKRQLEHAKHCKNCEELKKSLERFLNQNNVLQTNNKQLDEDVNMLKNVVYRLNVQMERYQRKLRKNTTAQITDGGVESSEIVTNGVITSLPEDHADHPHVPISWGSVNSHTLGPLLDAYQETIAEKEEIIQNYESELAHFTGKLQEILNENETLHKKLTVDDECSAKLSIELEKVKTELKDTKDQNDLLIKKCALKQDKLEEVLRCYEQKVEEVRRDYNVVVEQYHKSRIEVSTLKERNKSLLDSQDEFKHERQNYIPVSVHTSSVNECKRWYEELKQQYEQEKNKMKEAINLLQTQKLDLETKIKAHEKQLKKSEGQYVDLQHTLQEMQLSRNACRKQLHKAMSFAKDLVAEQESLLQTLHVRQQENKAVKKIGSDIAFRMDSLKSQLKTVQRDAWNELSSVEQKLQDQDSVIVSMKRAHDEEVERLKQIIRQKEESNILLKGSSSSIPTPHYLLLKDRNINT